MEGARFTPTRRALVFWTLFIGIGAVAGAAGMLLDPTGRAMGMDAMLPYFQKLPLAPVLFQDFTFSGIAASITNRGKGPGQQVCSGLVSYRDKVRPAPFGAGRLLSNKNP